MLITALGLLVLPCPAAMAAQTSGSVAPAPFALPGRQEPLRDMPLREDFFFQLQNQPTRRQGGHRIDVAVGVRYRSGMTALGGPLPYPDYRLLQAGIEALLEPTAAVPINSWWEVVVKAMAHAVMERGRGTLAGVTVQLRIHPLCQSSRISTAEPALWRAAQASLGEAPQLPYPSLEPACHSSRSPDR